MHNRKPTSSLSRRLFVGAKICERYLIGILIPSRNDTHARVPDLCQSLSIMTRIREAYNSGFPAGIQSDKHHLWDQPVRERQRRWRETDLMNQ
jgi:hypothetical protein